MHSGAWMVGIEFLGKCVGVQISAFIPWQAKQSMLFAMLLHENDDWSGKGLPEHCLSNAAQPSNPGCHEYQKVWLRFVYVHLASYKSTVCRMGWVLHAAAVITYYLLGLPP